MFLLCVCVSRCVLRPLPAVPGAVRRPLVPARDLTGAVHQPGGGQRLEDDLPVVWRYSTLFHQNQESGFSRDFSLTSTRFYVFLTGENLFITYPVYLNSTLSY